MLLKQAFASAIISFFIFSSDVVGSPLPVPDIDVDHVFDHPPGSGHPHSSNHPPPIPTLSEMMHHLNIHRDESMFHTCDLNKQGTCKDTRKWAKDHHPTYKVLGQLWIDQDYQKPWHVEEEASKKFFDVASQAMARMSSGTVYVVMGPWKQKDGKDWYDQSVWARKEWPELEKNKEVKSVIRVNPATGETIDIK